MERYREDRARAIKFRCVLLAVPPVRCSGEKPVRKKSIPVGRVLSLACSPGGSRRPSPETGRSCAEEEQKLGTARAEAPKLHQHLKEPLLQECRLVPCEQGGVWATLTRLGLVGCADGWWRFLYFFAFCVFLFSEGDFPKNGLICGRACFRKSEKIENYGRKYSIDSVSQT